ncbi:MAG: acetoacetate decarboxylase family protein [Halioglobus sp.]
MSSISPHADRRFNIEGNELGYPTLFHDGSASVGMFVVASNVANELIADSGFTVAEIAPGKAVMSFAGVHYTDTECGSYEEIGCAFFVNKVSGRPSIPYLGSWMNILRGKQPSFTWYLPVTQRSALECGIQMWGYPKTVEDIRHSKTEGRTVTTLHRDGEEVLRYSVSNLGSRTLKSIDAPVYSIFEGKPHLGYLTQQFSEAGYGRDGELLLSDHALVEPLRRLGLPKKPLLSGHMGRLHFSMSAPEPLN